MYKRQACRLHDHTIENHTLTIYGFWDQSIVKKNKIDESFLKKDALPPTLEA